MSQSEQENKKEENVIISTKSRNTYFFGFLCKNITNWEIVTICRERLKSRKYYNLHENTTIYTIYSKNRKSKKTSQFPQENE